mmetsp:Transcript_483/g.838  ORF Transcript_483/g.838 Transcript_483/m.838 type:complete len:280 (-) Transcript_483:532-1371(-)
MDAKALCATADSGKDATPLASGGFGETSTPEASSADSSSSALGSVFTAAIPVLSSAYSLCATSPVLPSFSPSLFSPSLLSLGLFDSCMLSARAIAICSSSVTPRNNKVAESIKAGGDSGPLRTRGAGYPGVGKREPEGGNEPAPLREAIISWTRGKPSCACWLASNGLLLVDEVPCSRRRLSSSCILKRIAASSTTKSSSELTSPLPPRSKRSTISFQLRRLFRPDIKAGSDIILEKRLRLPEPPSARLWSKTSLARLPCVRLYSISFWMRLCSASCST